jgi:hypothetical protein
MYRTLRLTFALALVAVAVASVVAQSNVTTMSGTIEAVNAPAGHFTLRSAEGTLTALPAPEEVLASLQPGDAVEVLMAGPNAMIIRKLSSAPPSALYSALPRSPPLDEGLGEHDRRALSQ